MPCYYPLDAYRAKTVGKNGRRGVVFNRRDGFVDQPLKLSCGQCIGCRLERSRQWAARCVHEASLHDRNCFITLTYDNDHLPADMSLDVVHWQKFIRSLRKRSGEKIRFFHAGEYGDLTARPHYHAILFGYDFDDKVYHMKTKSDSIIYRSSFLESVWPFGFSSIGEVTFESAAYVARYCLKKITGEGAEDHYQGRRPEYTTMSRRPGIAADWLSQYQDDVYPRDQVIMRGVPMRPPRFYDNRYEVVDPEQLQDVKAARVRRSKMSDQDEKTLDRLRVREEVKKAEMSLYKRGFEHE